MTSQTVELEEDNLKVAVHVMRNGGCATSASLSYVRRIRLSASAAGRSRTSRHISGLVFEYHNSERDSIVGQWLEEIDSMDLGSGDFPIHVRVWYTQEAHPQNTLRENNGKVVGLMLSTFRGVSKQVLLEDPEDLLCLDYYSNPLEEMVSQYSPICLSSNFLDGLTAHFSLDSCGVSTITLTTSRLSGDRRRH